MADIQAIDIPKWGLTMEEGTVDSWHLKEGDSFSKGDKLCVVESSKISNDLEAPFDGTLRRIVAHSGDTLPVGALIAVSADPSVSDADIDAFIAANSDGEAAPEPETPATAPAAPAPAAPAATPAAPAPTPAAAPAAVASSGTTTVPASLKGTTAAGTVFATPHALKFAEKHGVDLSKVQGTGRGDRISVQDIEDAIVAAGGSVAVTTVSKSGVPLHSLADDSGVPATPVARRLATELGINLNDCRRTARGGRVGKADVEEAQRKFAPETLAPAVTAEIAAEEADYVVEPMSAIRKVIAKRLQASKQQAPHYRVTMDLVLDDLLAVRKQINTNVPGVKVSVNDMIIKAVAMALVKVPDVNVQYDEASQSILKFKNADVSVAVASPNGLITPIVRSANLKSFGEISNEMHSLITKAKAGTLKPDEFQGGTFSISNLGMFGVPQFDAIINPPQAAILAVGAGEKRVVVQGDQFVAKTVMRVSMSSDHRVIDGALAATFLKELKQLVESPALMLA